MEGRIFISYSRKDLDAVTPIKEELESLGFSCWMDIYGIESGREFTQEIIDAIDKSTAFLFFLSTNSQESEWARKEIDYAKDERKRVVLVKINDDPMTKKFRFDFGRADVIDWRAPEQREKLLRDLRTWSEGMGTQVAGEMVKKPIPFGEELLQHLDKWLPWESFRAVAGLEFHDGDGKASMTAHVVGSPWGVFIVGYNDTTSECSEDLELWMPTEEQMRTFAARASKQCGLRRELVRCLFAVPSRILRNRNLPDSIHDWIVSEEGIVEALKRYMNEIPVVDWKNNHRKITKCLESFPMTQYGREANIIKHFTAKTVEEVEAGASLLAWVDNPSEELLDVAEKICHFLCGNGGGRIAEGVRSWFRVMADRGNVIAMDHYGWLLEGGDGERARWFRMAAELGGAHAQNSLGYFVKEGKGGLVRNPDEAVRLFRASAEQGNRFGQCNLADLNGFHADPVRFFHQDWTEAFRLYRLSADQGYPWAQYHVGECYEKGLGTCIDISEARKWYKRAMRPDPWYKMAPGQQTLNKMARDALARLS